MNDDSRAGPPDREGDLEDTAAELASVLSDLRREIVEERERRGPPAPPRGPLGLPRPPSPSEVLRFTDEVAIPAALAVLEANVKLLEALQRGIRMAETGREAGERGERAADRATAAGRETLSRLEGALADLQRAVEGEGLPENETARALLRDARELRDEIEGELRAGAERERESRDPDDALDGSEDTGVDVDVEGELETLKDRYGTEEGDPDEGAADDDPGEADDGDEGDAGAP